MSEKHIIINKNELTDSLIIFNEELLPIVFCSENYEKKSILLHFKNFSGAFQDCESFKTSQKTQKDLINLENSEQHRHFFNFQNKTHLEQK